MRDIWQSSKKDLAASQTSSSPVADRSAVSLRVLATTDIHMQLSGFDYINDRPGDTSGLAGLASLIQTARDEATAAGASCILLDNGDLLQGSPLDAEAVRTPVTASHPVVACLTHLGYDAIGVGNHDLDHGLTYLRDIAAALPMPVVASNLSLRGANPLQASALLEPVQPHKGIPRPPRIGIVSVLPEATAIWNAEQLRGEAVALPARPCLEREVPALRMAGADLVIALAHMGIEGCETAETCVDDARCLLAVPGIDVVISGHTHRRLPGDDHAGYRDVDARRGMLGSRPAVMPGFNASDLAIIDLKLGWQDGQGWTIRKQDINLRRNTDRVPPDPAILRHCDTAHQRTREILTQPCGQNTQPLHNFFSLAMPTSTCALVASAKYRLVSQGLAGRPEAKLPILATAAAHTAGGRGGPAHFLHVPPGPIFRRHLAALSPYTNAICALRVTGADLQDWLENAAGVFHRLQPDAKDQPLLQRDRPAFDFDTIFGLEYIIDPTQPTGQRVRSIRFQGSAISADQEFILATNVFRAAGGGGGRRFDARDVVFQSETDDAAALLSLLEDTGFPFGLNEKPWGFAHSCGVHAVIRSAPESVQYLREIAHLSPQPLGTDDQGFARIRLRL